jgi:hypothetical protein
MLGATKLVAAGVIVVLFGGFLLAGVFTTQLVDESAPAAAPASPTGTMASCPPGSTPDEPGPIDQPRPPGAEAIAFDRAAGKVVYLAEVKGVRETWHFDVCTNTWSLAQRGVDPSDFPGGPGVYDPVAGLTVLVSDEAVWVYDLPSNTWTKRPVSSPMVWGPIRLAYDAGAGRVVARSLDSPHPMWSYDVGADRWQRIDESGTPSTDWRPWHVLLTYDRTVDRLLKYDLRGNVELFDGETSTWEPTAAQAPTFAYGGYESWGGEIVYDEAAGRTVLSSDGHVIAYDAAADRWETLSDPASFDGSIDPSLSAPRAMHNHLLYDPLNERIVIVGGDVKVPDPVIWAPRDDVWAFDTRAREWIELVPSKDSVASSATSPE